MNQCCFHLTPNLIQFIPWGIYPYLGLFYQIVCFILLIDIGLILKKMLTRMTMKSMKTFHRLVHDQQITVENIYIQNTSMSEEYTETQIW